MADQTKFTIDSEDQEMYRKLKETWLSESKPGFVIFGKNTFKVYMKDDQPEFWYYDNQTAYQSRSFGR